MEEEKLSHDAFKAGVKKGTINIKIMDMPLFRDIGSNRFLNIIEKLLIALNILLLVTIPIMCFAFHNWTFLLSFVGCFIGWILHLMCIGQQKASIRIKTSITVIVMFIVASAIIIYNYNLISIASFILLCAFLEFIYFYFAGNLPVEMTITKLVKDENEYYLALNNHVIEIYIDKTYRAFMAANGNKEAREGIEKEVNIELEKYLKGENVSAYEEKGNAKYNSADYQGAIADYTQVIAINPKYAEAYKKRGYAKDHLGDYYGAIQDYTRAIDINPKYTDAYYNRGFAKEGLGDDQGAIEDYTQAITIDPKYAEAYKKRGQAKDHLGDYYGAIQDYNQAIAINPNNSNDTSTYIERGKAKLNLQDKQGACQDWEKAGELGDSEAYKLIQKYCQ